MAPSWITMSKDAKPGTSATPSQRPARSMCAVDDTGRYSVNPSTMPRIAATNQVMVAIVMDRRPPGPLRRAA